MSERRSIPQPSGKTTVRDPRPRPAARPGARRRCRRGGAYVLFLTTAMLVTVIGLSALTAVRVKLRAARGVGDSATARLYARSGVEVAVLAMYGDAAWRDKTPQGAWQPTVAIGNASYSWKLVDETNASLTADRNSHVRAYGKGVCGDAVWVYSVLVQPPLEALGSRTDLLVNGDFESGTAGWFGSSCTIANDFGIPHGGTSSLLATGLVGVTSGPEQDLGTLIESGRSYEVDLWVYLVDQSATVRATLWIESTDGAYPFEISKDVGVGTWTRISGQVTPIWTGTLVSVNLSVTGPTVGDFKIDDAHMWESQASKARAIGVLPGTWRREPQ